jgi:hypothetical protein
VHKAVLCRQQLFSDEQGNQMQIRPLTVIRYFSLLAFILLPVTLSAQESTPNLAESWEFIPKPGHQADFEAAYLEHLALREEAGDPREWDVYVPEIGTALDTYAVRHCCFAWADQDSYQEWNFKNADLFKHWNDIVAPHVASTGHYYYEIDFANSHWPEAAGSPRMMGVTRFKIAPGKAAEFHAVRTEISQIALNQGWSAAGNHWNWYDRIGDSPLAGVAIPFDNFADMAPGEQQFSAFLVEHMGEERATALMERLSSSISGSSYTIWVHRSDLSSPRD